MIRTILLNCGISGTSGEVECRRGEGRNDRRMAKRSVRGLVDFRAETGRAALGMTFGLEDDVIFLPRVFLVFPFFKSRVARSKRPI